MSPLTENLSLTSLSNDCLFLINSFFFLLNLLSGIKNHEGSKTLPSLQAKLAYHSLIDSGRRQEMSGSETEDLITYSTISAIKFMFISILLAVQVPEVNSVAQVYIANSAGYTVYVSSCLCYKGTCH